MWEIIVLGEVPGTQIQVSFESWLWFVIGIIAGISAFLTMQFIKQSRVIPALRIRYIIRSAAYTQWLITHGHIRA